ncbi:glutamyl-tRNA synthetase [Marinitoga hydrogenitolerans DSM 16785]|uniref:Glutamate--tRNA ligase n=1 Tax=Marinitoga hydrogenitolerans (strain DSM 16785 / JCM 12826 / AT1271) TaxID=1122195 RepID=A0A1M4UAI1_MARH1|nr:glutamate--tRNA ligase [Marinitoga hydrogenitolerans]SHE53563.1 glutamyl-tRNA synthetase [Marinitoga hydrogenitolerans DSM 16785]
MVRLRFAPSPTGNLHVGGVRTALFNWLFAKKYNGKFVLRIEDTDLERSTKEYEESIIEALKWCGLDWDEGPDIGGDFGPYRQSERIKLYKKYINLLIEKNMAYYAVYDKNNNIIHVSKEYPEKYKDESIVVKFKVNKNINTEFNDLLKGRIQFRNNLIEDFIILRSNGIPVYNFTVVIDDHFMHITHVIRGEDHISNTQKQIMIYNALGWEIPKFMHIPLILGNDRKPLSKRHGGTTVDYFRKEGILKDALMNYLALLGWTVDNEIFKFKDKINSFSPEKISNKGVIFDYEKLEWICGKHLREKDINGVYFEFIEWLKYTEDYKTENIISENKEYSLKVLGICREKINTFKQLKEFMYNFFIDDFNYEERFVEKYLKKEWAKDVIKVSIEKFEKLEDYSLENVEKTVREIAELKFTSKKNTFQIIRGSVLGKLVTPGLFESISVLGKIRVITRLRKAEVYINEYFGK